MKLEKLITINTNLLDFTLLSKLNFNFKFYSEENYTYLHEINRKLIEDNEKNNDSQYCKYLISLHKKLEVVLRKDIFNDSDDSE